MEFEWDKTKCQSNIRTHGIDFVDACAAFDGYILTVEDTRLAYAEPRFITIGLVRGALLS